MRLSVRSYPHPVLGNRDDVPGAGFQAALDMTSDRQTIYIDTEITCSCGTINAMLLSGVASFVMHVECTNTLFRRAFVFDKTRHRIAIPADNLNDTVEVNVFIRATKDIPAYSMPEAHSDYENVAFDVRKGSILAVAEGHMFHIESSFDSLSRIGSIMQIHESHKDGDCPMEMSFEGDKIVIYLSKSDLADYKLLKHREGISGPLTTMIILPVLIEALHILKTESDGIEDRRRWVRSLTSRIEKLSLKKEEQPISLAQKLLEHPIKRALASSRMFVESNT